MKNIEISTHAREQMVERRMLEEEVITAIRLGDMEPPRKGRKMYGRTSTSVKTGGGGDMSSNRWHLS